MITLNQIIPCMHFWAPPDLHADIPLFFVLFSFKGITLRLLIMLLSFCGLFHLWIIEQSSTNANKVRGALGTLETQEQ